MDNSVEAHPFSAGGSGFQHFLAHHGLALSEQSFADTADVPRSIVSITVEKAPALVALRR